MALFGLRYDFRLPAFGTATQAELYQTALEQCEWADRLGFATVTLSEHHGSPDGYLPSPIVFAAAVAGACYVASTNRPRAEGDVAIGGPSLVIAPDGDVLVETESAVSVATLERDVVATARKNYPGYLDVRADLYASTWGKLAR